MNQLSSTKKLVSASALMAAGTLISRILGVVKVMLIGFILGYGTRQADMYSIAQLVPNSIYLLFAGGALNSVLVPQIVRAIKNDDDGGRAYTNRIMTAFMLIVTALTLVALIGAPLLAGIYTSAEWRVPELSAQWASIVALVYLTVPQIFFFGAFFLLGQILNARDNYAPMTWAPITNNLVGIAVLCLYLYVWGNQQDHGAAFTTEQILVLGIGSTLGIVVQTLALLPYVRRVGFKLRPRFDLKGVGLGKTFSLAKWTLGFVATSQLAVIVVNRLATAATASGHGAGLNVYSNAFLVWILPHSLITVSLATAMLTQTSRLAAAGDLRSVAAEFTKTTRLGLVAIVPCTVAFLALSGPIVSLLFGHGSGEQDALWIAWTLLAFATCLIPYTIQFMGMRAFYALEDTRTPFLLQVLISGVNIVAALLFVWLANVIWGDESPAWIAPALGLAFSVAYVVGAAVTWRALGKPLPTLGVRPLVMHVVRLLLSSGLGGVAAYFAAQGIIAVLGGGKLSALLACAVGGLLIVASFVGLGKVFKVKELTSLTDLIANRLGRRREEPASDEEAAVERSTILAAEAFEWDAPTQIIPAIFFDEGPPTVVRNRAPRSEHTFSDLLGEDPADDAEDFDETPEETTGRLDMSAYFASVDQNRIATVGTLLNTRYELVESLADRHGTETWRAHDQVLSRDVVVHVMAPGDPRTQELLLAARKGAAATDSRFLRVLDADEFPAPVDGIGAYVVAEYAAGRSLTKLLAKGPLSSIEAAHIARELADALTGVHAQGLFHGEINPDNVIITNAGAVRIVGFGVEAALVGGERATAWAECEEVDVEGIGKVLYATLVRHWPGGAAWGLPAAPTSRGAVLPAKEIDPSISPALNRIAAATLSAPGLLGERRITTASQLAAELTAVLGTADASADLEARVRAWRDAEDVPVAAVASEDEHTVAQGIRLAPVTPASTSSPDDFGVVRPAKPRRGLWVIAILALASLLVALLAVGLTSARNSAQPQQPTGGTSASTTPGGSAPAEVSIASAAAFDPSTDGGDDEENNAEAGLAIDGNPDTAWTTTRYHNRSQLGGLKPGVGLLLDLGEARSVSSVEVTLTGPSAVELRVPNGSEASTRTEADWNVVASNDAAEGTVTLSPGAPVETRWVLIYLTNLPQVAENRYQGAIAEVSVN